MILSNENKKLIYLKYSIFIILLLILITPFLINIYLNIDNTFILDSTVYGFNYGKAIKDFIFDKSLFFSGNYSISLFAYLPFFIPLYILGMFFSQINAYFVFIIIIYTISFYCGVKLFLEIIGNKSTTNNIYVYIISSLLSFLFLTSLSNFNLFTSSIFFTISNISFLILLYCILMYHKRNNPLYLIGVLSFSLFSSFNFTNLILNIIFINLITGIINIRTINNQFFKKTLILNLYFLPAMIISLIPIIIGLQYFGTNIGVSFQIFQEDFYSLNANYINIFKQNTFWGLFGSSNGKLYYDFSTFYASPLNSVFAFILYAYIVFMIIYNKLYNKLETSLIMILFLISFQFMLGLNNPVYKYLYDNFTYFQMFRNITKVSSFLLLLALILFALQIKSFKQKRKYYLFSIVIIIVSTYYNTPYLSYSEYFFKERTLEKIPESYVEMSDYVNYNVSNNDKILILPGTYINERYKFDNNEVVPQGYIFDALLDNDITSYRVARDLMGSSIFTKDINNIYLNNNGKFEFNPRGLEYVANKYNFNYILITEDLVSEYQNIDIIKDWVKDNNYNIVKATGSISLYKNNSIGKPNVYLNNSDTFSYKRQNPKNFNINLSDIQSTETIYFLEWFNPQWNLYLNPIDSNSKDCNIIQEYNNEGKNIKECEHTQKFFEGEELSYLWKQPVFEDSHKLVYDYANQWTIDPDYIKANFDKSYYKENPDGSIDIELTLYFKPQSYFYLGIIISGTTLILCLGYLGYSFYRKKSINNLT